MADEAAIAELLTLLAASEELHALGYSAFTTPAAALVVQKDRIFHGLWRATSAGLKWTPAAAGAKSVLAASPHEAMRYTLAYLRGEVTD